MERSLEIVRRHREAGTLYDEQGKLAPGCSRNWARPATGAC